LVGTWSVLGGYLVGNMVGTTQKLGSFQYHLNYMFITMIFCTFFSIPIQKEDIHNANINKKSHNEWDVLKNK
jgi:hypothetical protein